LESMGCTELFAAVRRLAPLRMLGKPSVIAQLNANTFKLCAGSKTDYLLVGSDAGTMAMLQFETDRQQWKAVHLETYGKSGVRRIVPGEYLAVDPLGRAVLHGAIEKQKFVYVLNRDAQGSPTISSPLEAHRPRTLCVDITGMDVGLDNPCYAALEIDYTDADEDPSGEAAADCAKMLTIYELDIGLNHVVRKSSEETDRDAHMVLAVPGGDFGPGGVLVCSENLLLWHKPGHTPLRTVLPRRSSMPDERGLMVVAASVHKQKKAGFILLQSELGDLYKVTLPRTEDGLGASDLVVQYFDSIPPCSSLAVTKRGFLFAAAEAGDHRVYQFTSVGDGDESAVAHAMGDAEQEVTCPLFVPRTLTNLQLVHTSEALAPITGLKVVTGAAAAAESGAGTVASLEALTSAVDASTDGSVAALTGDARYVALCGKGAQSSLRLLKQGLPVAELANSPLPGVPQAVWTVEAHDSRISPEQAQDLALPIGTSSYEGRDSWDKYIVVSFTDATLVMSIGSSVEQVKDSGFITDAPTLAIVRLSSNAYVQVTPRTMLVLRIGAEGEKRVQEWKPPDGRLLQHAAANSAQVLLSLSPAPSSSAVDAATAGSMVVYFQVDSMGNLEEIERRDVGVAVTALAISRVPAGRLAAPFAMLADSSNAVRVLSLATEGARLQQKSSLAVASGVVSMQMVRMSAGSWMDGEADTCMYAFVGLDNGMMYRAVVDAVTGTLGDSRVRVMGGAPVKVCPIMLQGTPAVLALCTRAWLCHNQQGRYICSPLDHVPLQHAADFCASVCPEGVVAVAGSSMRIFSVQPSSSTFNSTVIPCDYTPRQAVRVGSTALLAVAECDHSTFSASQRAVVLKALQEAGEVPPDASTDTRQVGYALPDEAGRWASAVRLLDSASGSGVHSVEIEGNQGALCVASVLFPDKGAQPFVVVGTAVGLQYHPRRHEGGQLHVYRVTPEHQLVHVHSTPVDDIPYSVCPFQGRLLVGLGKKVVLFDLGKKRLLKKAESKALVSAVKTLAASGDRVVAGDAADSVTMFKYNRSSNRLVAFADDTYPRHLQAVALLDHDSMAVADRFGNVAVLRLPPDASDEIGGADAGSAALWGGGALGGAEYKLDLVAHFHVGEVVTSLTKTMMPGGQEAILYATIAGRIGVLCPCSSHSEVDFFTHLELFLRNEGDLKLLGREHMAYRSTYIPVKRVLDGDLCEQFLGMPPAAQKRIAAQLERTVADVVRRIEERRAKIM